MISAEFGTQLLTLPYIFENRYFTIPDYQRAYAWEKTQINDLLKDIDHLLKDTSSLRHYTGTLVLSRTDASNEEEYHVIDGQQRLTTIVILIRALCEKLPDEIKNQLSSLYINRGNIGNERTILALNSDTHLYFERVIIKNLSNYHQQETLVSHNRLQEAFKLIEKWLNEHIESGTNINKIQNVIENALGFLVYVPNEDAESGIMFEVINNRGKNLSELEKVKNYLIYCCVKLSAHTLRKSINTDWSSILNNLNISNKTSQTDEGSFLRYCIVTHFKASKTNSQYGYEEIKKKFALEKAYDNAEIQQHIINEISDFVLFLKSASVWYTHLYGNSKNKIPADLRQILIKICSQEQHASIMPLYLALVIKLHGNQNKLISLLRLLEILNFRVYIARNMTPRSDTGQGDLYKYAYQYYHEDIWHELNNEGIDLEKLSIKTHEDALEYYLVRFILWHAADERFKNSLILEQESPYDFYKWGGLRYFLMNYEEKLQPNKTIQIEKILLSRSEGKSADYLSIEHLWAIENRNQDGENNRKVDLFEKRRLGNLTLLELRLNIQGNKEGIDTKIKKYTRGFNDEPPTDLEQVRKLSNNVKRLINNHKKDQRKGKNYYLKFYKDLNKIQEDTYIKFAETRWSIKSFIGYTEIIKNAEIENLEDE